MKKLNIYLLTFILFSGILNAADKVSTTFTASGKKHALYYTIPKNYDAAKSYPLVVGLHYCGGTASSYRNSLTPLADSLGVIIVCPDNSTKQIPDAELDIVTAAIDSARSAYNIDSTSVYLTGMSCNAEVTFRQGMKKLYPFKGIFPWVPYIQSTNFSIYDLDSDMPVVLAVGTEDGNYDILMSLEDSLKKHGANVNLVLVPGIGHIEIFDAFANTMITCLRYINSPKTITTQKIVNFGMLNTDTAKEVAIDFKYAGTKDLQVKLITGYNICVEKAELSYTKGDTFAHISITPKVGKSGTTKFVVEVSEIDGPAIAQSTFNVRVNRVPSSIKNVGYEFKTSISPNPAKGNINLTSTAPINGCEIYDISGKIVLKKIVSGTSNTIDISKLNAGIYFVKSSSESAVYTEKLYVQ